MSMKISGSCLVSESDLTNEWIPSSCLNGSRTTLNVPSIYQVLALAAGEDDVSLTFKEIIGKEV